MRAAMDEIVEREGAYWTDQFNNRDALDGYAQLGAELLEQLPPPSTVDVFCASVGTAGMLAGVASYLHDHGSAARVVALEPASAPMLTAGVSGPHRVEGVGTGVVPPLLEACAVSEARTVDEQEARALARQLARTEGLLVGTSSALNILGAIHCASDLGPGHTVVTVTADTGLKYLTGDLFDH
jgi:cysteine synthase